MRSFIRNNGYEGILSRVAVMVLLLAASLPCFAAPAEGDGSELSARGFFVRLQSPSLEILGKSTRLDMLDYWDADSVYKATNAIGGLSWLCAVSQDYLKVQVTPVSALELKILPLGKGSVVMSVYTVGGESQAEDSRIDFYDGDGTTLDAGRYFKAPDLSRFFDIPKGSVTTMKEIREMIPFPTVAYSASADSDDLTARLTVGEFMDVDDYNIVRLFLRPEVRMKWTGKYK